VVLFNKVGVDMEEEKNESLDAGLFSTSDDISEDISMPLPVPVSKDVNKNEPFGNILDANQNSLSKTDWGNTVSTVDSKKPAVVLSSDVHLPPEIVYAKMFICGQSGSGKSFTTGVLMEEMARLGLQFVCFDALGAHKGVKQLPNVVEIVPTMEMQPNMERFVDEIERNPDMSAVIDCSHVDDATVQKIIAEYVENLFKKRLGRGIMTIIEECQDLVPQQKPSLESYGPIVKLCKKGRQYGYGVCLISQRPHEVAKAALTQCTIHIIHAVIQTRDLMAVKDQIAQGTDRNATNSLLDSIRNFEAGECLLYSPSLVPQMRGTREHFVQTTIRSDRSTEHAGDNVEVTVKGVDNNWQTNSLNMERPDTLGGMRVHFNQGQDYNPYEALPESKQVESIPVTQTFSSMGNFDTNSIEDDDWWPQNMESDSMVKSSAGEWHNTDGSYVSPLAYDGLQSEEMWNADITGEIKKALPSENDSSIVKTAKVLGAILLTAGGLFFMLKKPTMPTVMAEADKSKWMKRAETLYTEEEDNDLQN